jgi:hypothetical protein
MHLECGAVYSVSMGVLCVQLRAVDAMNRPELFPEHAQLAITTLDCFIDHSASPSSSSSSSSSSGERKSVSVSMSVSVV